MPGNQPDQNIELKVGYMVKRSQGKSTLGAINFKKRVFVLTPSCLSYFDGTLEVRDNTIVATPLSLNVLSSFIVYMYINILYTYWMPGVYNWERVD